MPHSHQIYDSDKHFVIDPITRNITNNSSKLTIMQYDHNSERFTFEIPRVIEGHDMSLSDVVRVHFINIGSIKTNTNSGVYEVDDVVVSSDDPDTITFSWLISGASTKYNGSLNFAIRFYCLSDESEIEYSWGTNIYSGINVANSLDNSETIVEDYVDVLEKWKQDTIDIWSDNTNKIIGNLNDLDTEAKNNLVAAINEAAQTGGGGISTTAKNLLITILRNAVYSTDQSNNITALETALGGGTTEPDVPVETTYAISNELTNCTTSNSATSVKENAAYSATLTANDGYTLTGGTVTITMGGVDITATAYADGVISIAAVTGVVEIFASAVAVQAEAALPENGLIAYFDFRTTTYNNAGNGGSTTIAPTKGSGQLYIWANNSISAQNEYGLKPANTRKWEYDQNGGTTQTALGNAFTVIQLTYGETPLFGFSYSNIPPRWMFVPKYINTSGSTIEAEKIIGNNFNSDSKLDYNFTVFRADGATLTEIFDTSRTTYNGGDIDGFSRWLDTPYGNIISTVDTKYCTAMAIYNRALTDVEIEAAREFMNTLEVTA